MARDFEGEVAFFGVAWKDDETNARAYIDNFDVPYPNALDTDERIFAMYRVPYQPVTVLITADGRIFDRIAGGISADFLTERIEALLDA